MKDEQVEELLYQALETEIGGVQIYETALQCAVNDDLRKEWEHYHEQTTEHVQIVQEALEAWGLDPRRDTPGRQVVRHIGESLVAAMQLALESAPAEAAEVVAAECVTLAETKDHLNWELIGEVAGKAKGDKGKALKDAYKRVEDQEDEHLYHTSGWGRELWIQALGLPAVLPPPEERKHVKTAIGASRARQDRTDMT
jgi:rubrerythrin